MLRVNMYIFNLILKKKEFYQHQPGKTKLYYVADVPGEVELLNFY